METYAKQNLRQDKAHVKAVSEVISSFVLSH